MLCVEGIPSPNLRIYGGRFYDTESDVFVVKINAIIQPVTVRGRTDRRVAANWDQAGRSGEGSETEASGARTTLPTTGYDGASKHLGNAFATHPPLCF